MAKPRVHRPAAVDWSVLEDDDSGAPASPVAAAIAAATAQVSARVKAAAQKKPSAARRVSFAPLPEPLHKRDEGRAVSPCRLAPVRGSVVSTATEECDPDFGAPLTDEWAGRDIGAIVREMQTGSALWGDLEYPPGCAMAASTDLSIVVPAVRRANTWDDFVDQPWYDELIELTSDVYGTEALAEESWEAMMGWLFQAGWYVRGWCRQWVSVDPDNGPARTWIPPRVLEELAAEDGKLVRRGYGAHRGHKCSGHHHHRPAEAAATAAPAVKAAPPKEKQTVIPRFCRAGAACAEAGCRFTHGNTIPVQNKVCAFDGRCSGDKRATCIFLHPSEGEVWTAELVRVRPVAAGGAGGE